MGSEASEVHSVFSKCSGASGPGHVPDVLVGAPGEAAATKASWEAADETTTQERGSRTRGDKCRLLDPLERLSSRGLT